MAHICSKLNGADAVKFMLHDTYMISEYDLDITC